MKYTVFNTITGMAGIGAMFGHLFEAGVNTSAGTLGMIWLVTGVVSVVGTLVMVELDTRRQNREERKYAEMMLKAYGR